MTITAPFLAALNHLLAQSSWARDRLRPHAGRHVRLNLAPFAATFTVTATGTFASTDEAPEVTLELPLSEAFAAAGGGLDALMAKPRISGSADLAEALAFVFRRLRWDAEEDLARFVGDIAAHRLATAAARLAQAPRRLAKALAGRSLVTAAEGEALSAGSRNLETGLARLETRIAHLRR
jgi:ubiquinone biosynthesis protein UbiJ